MKEMIEKANQTCLLQLRRENQKTSENRFEAILMDAIDESLGLLNNFNKLEVYQHLENTFKIKKQEIPYKTEEFADAMEKIFGRGAKLIEIRIIEAIHKRVPEFRFTPKRAVVIFKEYVASLREFLFQHS
jgi:rRNA pseudouridine-1189 N-methylase Emg1 (Nep1/Mra1 family)